MALPPTIAELLQFDRALMHEGEFLTEAATFEYVNVRQERRTLALAAGSLAYTVCQVPVVHLRGDAPSIEVTFTDGRTERIVGNALNRELSCEIFRRSHVIAQLTVTA